MIRSIKDKYNFDKMITIGEFLKKTRINKKIDISDISKELKINKNIIENIEKNNFPEYLKKVYLIGYIRAYAKYLDLNENEIVDNFKNQILYKKIETYDKISKPIKNLNIFSLSKFSSTLSLISVVFITSGFYFLFIKPNNFDLNYAITPELPENLTYELEELEMNMALDIKSKKNSIEINDSQVNNNIFKPESKISENSNLSSAIASLPQEKESSFNNLITLNFLDSTWIQLRDSKNNIILSQLMNSGDEYSYNISKNFSLTAGNAGNIIILIDGEVRGKLGKYGQVVDSLLIENNFNN